MAAQEEKWQKLKAKCPSDGDRKQGRSHAQLRFEFEVGRARNQVLGELSRVVRQTALPTTRRGGAGMVGLFRRR